MAVGDLDRDDRWDVVVGMGGPPRTTLLMSGPRGRFSPPQFLDSLNGNPLISGLGLAITDVNGDGNRDLVQTFLDHTRANDPDPTEVVVLLGDGTGGFGTRIVTRTVCCGSGVAAGDFNRDGKTDLAIAGAGVLLGDGTGGFTFRRPLAGVSVVVANLNRDRNLDLAVLDADEDPNPASLLMGRGDGGFSEYRQLRAGDVASLAVGRFNRDRWPDLATISSPGGRRVVRILLGTRGGRPRMEAQYRVGESPWEIEVADLNGDGKRDLVVKGLAAFESDEPSVQVLLGTGRGTFRRARRVTACCDGRLLAIGDFNRDHRPDLVTTSGRPAGDDRVSVLLNDTPR